MHTYSSHKHTYQSNRLENKRFGKQREFLLGCVEIVESIFFCTKQLHDRNINNMLVKEDEVMFSDISCPNVLFY